METKSGLTICLLPSITVSNLKEVVFCCASEIPRHIKDKMKEEIRREDTRNFESYVERLEKLLSQPSERQRKMGNSGNNIAGFDTKHLPNFSTSSIIDPQLWKKNNNGEPKS